MNPPRLCSVEGCIKKPRAKGLCVMHYARKARGFPEGYVPASMRTCKVVNCESPQKCRGYCGFHYMRKRRGQALHAPRREDLPKRVCSVEGCDEKHNAKGYCHRHYQRTLYSVDFDLPYNAKRPRQTLCSIEGCERVSVAKCLCNLHYIRMRRGQDMNKPPARLQDIHMCQMSNCRREVRSRGVCEYHERVIFRHGPYMLT